MELHYALVFLGTEDVVLSVAVGSESIRELKSASAYLQAEDYGIHVFRRVLPLHFAIGEGGLQPHLVRSLVYEVIVEIFLKAVHQFKEVVAHGTGNGIHHHHPVVRYVPTVHIHRIGQEDAIERSVLYLRQLQVIGVTARQHCSLWVGVRHLGTKRGHRLCHTHKGHEHQNQERYVSHAL